MLLGRRGGEGGGGKLRAPGTAAARAAPVVAGAGGCGMWERGGGRGGLALLQESPHYLAGRRWGRGGVARWLGLVLHHLVGSAVGVGKAMVADLVVVPVFVCA